VCLDGVVDEIVVENSVVIATPNNVYAVPSVVGEVVANYVVIA